MIAFCATISGSNDFAVRRLEEIALYSQEKEQFLQTFLELKNGIPSHDTFTRVFSHLDKKDFGECLCRWSNELFEQVEKWFENPNNCLNKSETEEKNGGRIEKRTCYVLPVHPLLDELQGWAELKNIVKIDSNVTKNSVTTYEIRYYLSSQIYNAEVFNQIVRNHCGVARAVY